MPGDGLLRIPRRTVVRVVELLSTPECRNRRGRSRLAGWVHPTGRSPAWGSSRQTQWLNRPGFDGASLTWKGRGHDRTEAPPT